MNRMDAMQILGIVDDGYDENIVKSAYRKLAKKYHPDNAETGNPKKFIEAAAALEILLRSDEEVSEARRGRETEEELSERISGVEAAFAEFSNDLQQKVNGDLGKVLDMIVDDFRSTTSSDDLYDNFSGRVDVHLNAAFKSICEEVNDFATQVTGSFDDWLYSALRETYSEMLEKEKAEAFYDSQIIFLSVLSGVMSMLSTSFSSILLLGAPPFSLYSFFPFWHSFSWVLISVICVYYSLVQRRVKRFVFEEASISIETTELELHAPKIHVKLERVVSSQEAGGLGALGGAALGARSGGLGGAIVGGLLGAMVGSQFGESLQDQKARIWPGYQAEISSSVDSIIDFLNRKIPDLLARVKDKILENYREEKIRATLLLTYSQEQSSKRSLTPLKGVMARVFTTSDGLLVLLGTFLGIIGVWFGMITS